MKVVWFVNGYQLTGFWSRKLRHGNDTKLKFPSDWPHYPLRVFMLFFPSIPYPQMSSMNRGANWIGHCIYTKLVYEVGRWHMLFLAAPPTKVSRHAGPNSQKSGAGVVRNTKNHHSRQTVLSLFKSSLSGRQKLGNISYRLLANSYFRTENCKDLPSNPSSNFMASIRSLHDSTRCSTTQDSIINRPFPPPTTLGK